MAFIKETMVSINMHGGSHVGTVCSVLTSFYQAQGEQKPERGCALNNE